MSHTIVVSTYNRLASLKRLLISLLNSDFSGYDGVRLLISVDKHKECEGRILDYLKDFNWPFGEFVIKKHPERLGLKKHFFFCCDLSITYGGIIFLEDDFVVSPLFYKYACEASSFYESDNRIAGISLYELRLNEFANRPFTPVLDEGEQYFVQIPSWGKVITRNKWMAFKNWLGEVDLEALDSILPTMVKLWPKTSFKREYIKFLISTERFFVFPRKSFLTNFGDAGQHYTATDNRAQRPILLIDKSSANLPNWHFSTFDNSLSKYDVYMEILPEVLRKYNPEMFANKEFIVDLYGIKPKSLLITKEFVLTAKKTTNHVYGFDRRLMPHEVNVLMGIEGNNFYFSKSEDIIGRNKTFKRYLEDNLYDTQHSSIFKLLLIDLTKTYRQIKSKIFKK